MYNHLPLDILNSSNVYHCKAQCKSVNGTLWAILPKQIQVFVLVLLPGTILIVF